MNHQETARILAVLKAVWPTHPVNEHTVAAYQMALDDLPYAAVNAATAAWLQVGQPFFPKPSELRALIAERVLGLPSAEEAWGEVMRQIREVGSYGVPSWSCPAISSAVRALGWRTICASEEIGVERAHFYRTYQAYRERALREAPLAELWAGATTPALTEVTT